MADTKITDTETDIEQHAPPVSDDLVIPFKVGDGPIRGRIVRLGASIDQILSAHPFENSVKELLGEAATLTIMMGAALKFDGRFIFQMQGDGPAPMLVADYTTDGALRAMASVKNDNDAAAAFAAPRPCLPLLVGKGHMAITVDQGPDMERYQGVTPIVGETLAESAVAYFDQSEQIPTAIKLAVGRIARPGEKERWRAGGVMVQFVPGEGGARERGEAALKAPEDREAWDRAAAFLETTQADELLDPSISAEELLYRLYHEDGVRVFDAGPVRAACACNSDKISAVLSRYSTEELADMVEDGAIRVTCEFCRTEYRFSQTGVLQEQ